MATCLLASDRVMLMIAFGKTLSQISEEMALSIKIISTDRTRILEKMQMQSNAEITHYATKNGLIK
jgi:two-component system invasion response regulator UvrY